MVEWSLVSAYHNYLVDGRLRNEWIAGNPRKREAFFLVAHPVPPGEPMPRISGRFFDQRGSLLLHMERNTPLENPGGLTSLETRDGWVLMDSSLESLLSAEVRSYENGYVTVLRGLLHDSNGKPVIRGDELGLHLLV